MFCINCGKEIKEGAAFCVNCGTPASGGAVAAPMPPPPREPTLAEELKIPSLWLWLAASCPLADAALVGVLLSPVWLLIWLANTERGRLAIFACILSAVGVHFLVRFLRQRAGASGGFRATVGFVYSLLKAVVTGRGAFREMDIWLLGEKGVALPKWVSSKFLSSAFWLAFFIGGKAARASKSAEVGGVLPAVCCLLFLALLIFNGPLYVFMRLRATHGSLARAGARAYAPLWWSLAAPVVTVLLIAALDALSG